MIGKGTRLLLRDIKFPSWLCKVEKVEIVAALGAGFETKNGVPHALSLAPAENSGTFGTGSTDILLINDVDNDQSHQLVSDLQAKVFANQGR